MEERVGDYRKDRVEEIEGDRKSFMEERVVS
jgi:hypothetical protein